MAPPSPTRPPFIVVIANIIISLLTRHLLLPSLLLVATTTIVLSAGVSGASTATTTTPLGSGGGGEGSGFLREEVLPEWELPHAHGHPVDAFATLLKENDWPPPGMGLHKYYAVQLREQQPQLDKQGHLSDSEEENQYGEHEKLLQTPEKISITPKVTSGAGMDMMHDEKHLFGDLAKETAMHQSPTSSSQESMRCMSSKSPAAPPPPPYPVALGEEPKPVQSQSQAFLIVKYRVVKSFPLPTSTDHTEGGDLRPESHYEVGGICLSHPYPKDTSGLDELGEVVLRLFSNLHRHLESEYLKVHPNGSQSAVAALLSHNDHPAQPPPSNTQAPASVPRKLVIGVDTPVVHNSIKKVGLTRTLLQKLAEQITGEEFTYDAHSWRNPPLALELDALRWKKEHEAIHFLGSSSPSLPLSNSKRRLWLLKAEVLRAGNPHELQSFSTFLAKNGWPETPTDGGNSRYLVWMGLEDEVVEQPRWSIGKKTVGVKRKIVEKPKNTIREVYAVVKYRIRATLRKETKRRMWFGKKETIEKAQYHYEVEAIAFSDKALFPQLNHDYPERVKTIRLFLQNLLIDVYMHLAKETPSTTAALSGQPRPESLKIPTDVPLFRWGVRLGVRFIERSDDNVLTSVAEVVTGRRSIYDAWSGDGLTLPLNAYKKAPLYKWGKFTAKCAGITVLFVVCTAMLWLPCH